MILNGHMLIFFLIRPVILESGIVEFQFPGTDSQFDQHGVFSFVVKGLLVSDTMGIDKFQGFELAHLIPAEKSYVPAFHLGGTDHPIVEIGFAIALNFDGYHSSLRDGGGFTCNIGDFPESIGAMQHL